MSPRSIIFITLVVNALFACVNCQVHGTTPTMNPAEPNQPESPSSPSSSSSARPSSTSSVTQVPMCNVPDSLKKEIHNHQNLIDRIIAEVTRGTYSGRYHSDLTDFVDTFGSRFAGTKVLEKSIEHIAVQASSNKLKVNLEPVTVPHWVRGTEEAFMIAPRIQKLGILGLGYSPGTEKNGLKGEVLCVSNFTELHARAREVPGKIVLFNSEFVNYSTSVQYRSKGPAKAAKLGAIATLVRSVTQFSIFSPHTGATDFEPKGKKIPAAAITLEDADMIHRLIKKGKKVEVYLRMDAHMAENQISRNLIADLPGSVQPNSFVTVSGHIDSWDVGQGALDDGVGAFLALHSLYVLKYMNIPSPKRTIRAILWTGEEIGLLGAKDYLRKHAAELPNWSAALEADMGSYNPLGLNFEGNSEAFCIMKEICSLFGSLNAMEVKNTTGVGSDISVFKSAGVPLLEPRYDLNPYFFFHHTQGDSMRTLNSTVMDKNLALVAGASYVLANLSVQLPRANTFT